jgi:hypothetical protein
MKKIFTLIATAMLVASPAFFTSCDDDPWDDPWMDAYNNANYNGGGYQDNNGNTVLDEAEILNGEWDGTMTYTNGDNGQRSQFYANMTFVQNNSNAIKGTGTEVDYTLDANGNVSDTQTLKFNWYIDENTGDIYIRYLTGNGLTFVMDLSASQHGFHLDEANGIFSGYMIGTNNNDLIYIDLKRQTNNEAKSATRAASVSNRVIGSGNSITPLTGGTMQLNTRR